MAVNNQSRYPLPVAYPRNRLRTIRTVVMICGVAVLTVFLIPTAVTLEVRQEQSRPVPLAEAEPFPVSVDPVTKSIVENPQADALFAQHTGSLSAAADLASSVIAWFANLLENTGIYQSLGAVDGRLIVIRPGFRKEEVLAQLVQELNWNKQDQQQFLAAVQKQTPALSEGFFTPGTYVVDKSMTPDNVASLMNLAFNRDILSHYSTTTAEHVPLPEAITVASLLEREAKDTSDMRIISGIIWNRLFDNMNLQIDATLQYAKSTNAKKISTWWPKVMPKDKYIKSPYNTYQHPGLPPGPIAIPSVAAVLAALNPVPTTCLFYFHDKYGNFHCSETYAEHVKLLKKYYGQGK